MGHKITNVPLILKIWDNFLFSGKLAYGPFLGIFYGGLKIFDPHCTLENLGVKKVLAPSKYPLKWPIK
jgi:hypothetical protein